MSGQRDIYCIGATQMIIGTLGNSVFPTVVTPPPGCAELQMKLLGASGSTVQILPNVVAGSTISGQTAITGFAGYPLVTGEMYPIAGPAAFYLAATGATATVAIAFWFTSGGATLR